MSIVMAEAAIPGVTDTYLAELEAARRQAVARMARLTGEVRYPTRVADFDGVKARVVSVLNHEQVAAGRAVTTYLAGVLDHYGIPSDGIRVPVGYLGVDARGRYWTRLTGITARGVATSRDADRMDRVLGGLHQTAGSEAHRLARSVVRDICTYDDRFLGWRRVAEPGACAFCRMLASRGAVYTAVSVEATEAGKKYHYHCRCHAEAVPDEAKRRARARDMPGGRGRMGTRNPLGPRGEMDDEVLDLMSRLRSRGRVVEAAQSDAVIDARIMPIRPDVRGVAGEGWDEVEDYVDHMIRRTSPSVTDAERARAVDLAEAEARDWHAAVIDAQEEVARLREAIAHAEDIIDAQRSQWRAYGYRGPRLTARMRQDGIVQSQRANIATDAARLRDAEHVLAGNRQYLARAEERVGIAREHGIRPGLLDTWELHAQTSRTWVKGPVTVTVKNTSTVSMRARQELFEAIDEVLDRMPEWRRYTTEGVPRHFTFEVDGRSEARGAGGFAVLGGDYVNVSESSLALGHRPPVWIDQTERWGYEVEREHGWIRTVVAHELGHSTDVIGAEQDAARQALFDRMMADPVLRQASSTYGVTDWYEMYAEGFKMWIYGDRDNPMVRLLAEQFGWGTPRNRYTGPWLERP